MVDSQELYSSKTSALENFVYKWICDPILDRLPASLNPNSLTLTNHLIYWACLFFAASAPGLSGADALIARIMAGVAVFVSMLLDCLDGMHARRTGQTSHLGEFLDHWLDGLNTPLNAAAMALTLQLDPWTSAIVMVSMGMVYIVQLSVWHHSGKFLCPPTSGVDAQCLLSLSFIGAGIYFYVWPLAQFPEIGRWVGLIFGWTCVATAFKQVYWFSKRGATATVYGLRANLFVLALALLYPLGFIGGIEAFILMAVASWRIAGSYVLYTILGRSYGGLDFVLSLTLPAVLCMHFALGPITIASYGLGEGLALTATAVLGGLTLYDLATHFRQLRFLDGDVSSETT